MKFKKYVSPFFFFFVGWLKNRIEKKTKLLKFAQNTNNFIYLNKSSSRFINKIVIKKLFFFLEN